MDGGAEGGATTATTATSRWEEEAGLASEGSPPLSALTPTVIPRI